MVLTHCHMGFLDGVYPTNGQVEVDTIGMRGYPILRTNSATAATARQGFGGPKKGH